MGLKTCHIQVYKGTLGLRTVAIKVVHSTSEEEQARFVQEIARLRVLRDPNIVMFLGASLQASRTVLVMEYLPGVTSPSHFHLCDAFSALPVPTKAALVFRHFAPDIMSFMIHGGSAPIYWLCALKDPSSVRARFISTPINFASFGKGCVNLKLLCHGFVLPDDHCHLQGRAYQLSTPQT